LGASKWDTQPKGDKDDPMSADIVVLAGWRRGLPRRQPVDEAYARELGHVQPLAEFLAIPGGSAIEDGTLAVGRLLMFTVQELLWVLDPSF
jgi:hypothetical protein